jgi:oligogalacturonide transport system substrate-binding protein
MKKGLFSSALTAVLAASMLAGCSGSGAAASTAASVSVDSKSASEYDNCTIRFDWWGGDSRHKVTQEAVAAFMKKYPGINVEVNFGAWTDWETARALEYQAGNGSDLTQINYSWINDYDATGETFLDLNTESSIIDLTQYDSDLLKTCNDAKGQLAGVPLAVTGRTFYWNKTTFEKAGISTPTSLDDLIAAGKTFKEKLGDDYYPLEMGEYDRMLFISFYLQAQTGQPIIDANGKLTVSQDQLKQGLELIKKLEDNHVMPTQATMAGDGNVTLNENPKFIDGHYAGVFEWDSAPAKYIKNLGEGQELVVGSELKGLGDKATGVSDKVSMLFAITKTSEHPHEAAMLLNYLVNDEEGVKILGSERGIPSSKAAYDILDKAGKIDKTVAAAHKSVMDASPMYFSPLFDNAKLKGTSAAYTTIFDAVSYGQQSTDEGAKALYQAYMEVCKN